MARINLKDLAGFSGALALQLGIKDVKVSKRPTLSAKQTAEDTFAFQCKARGVPPPMREHLFAKDIGRLWRFDFCWKMYMVAMECEGLVVKYVNGEQIVTGRHCTIKGYEGDCIKYAKAAELGWTVVRFNQALIKNWTAIDMVIDVLRSRGWTPNEGRI